MAQSKKSIFKKVLPETGVLISRVVYLLATSTARLVIIAVAILVTGYLAYGWVWQPLQEKDVLPPGITRTVGTDPNILQSINNQRAERSQHIPYDFTRESQIIAPSRSTTTGATPAT